MTLTPLPLKIRWTIFGFIALLALGVRLPQLGVRPMHTDESINAYLTGQLLAGGSFHYDPRDRHGPGLFVVAEPVVRLLGAENFSGLTETELRLVPVIAGTITVLLFGVGVEMFGFIPCLVAALLFAFGPPAVYYDRYFIHESWFVCATFGLILAGWRMLKTNAILPAALAGFCAAFMLACKETAVIHFFAITAALLGGQRLRQKTGLPAGRLRWRTSLTAAGFFTFTVVLLFTWFGRNWPVFSDLLRAIPNFTARAGGEGHEKPFWYYAVLLGGGWSGADILLAAGMGFWRIVFRPASGSGPVLALYALLIFAIYSAIPYKTPWLALNFWLPLALLAGYAVEWFWLGVPKFSARMLILCLLAVLGVLIFHDTRERVFLMPADEKNPYAYAHTGEDLLRLPGRLEELVRQEKIPNPRIAVVAADPWPLPWYLRKFPQVGFWQPGQDAGAADLYLTSTDVPVGLANRLKNFRPEFFGWRPNVLLILWVPLNEPPGPSPPPTSPTP